MAFDVSAARIDITPTLATNPYLGGFGVQDEPRVATSDEPYAPLSCRCLVIWDDGNPNALITLDVLGIPRAMHQALRPRLVALAGWCGSDIVLQATHTHNGPVLVDALDPYIAYALTDLTLVQAYTTWLEDQVVSVVQAALAGARTPVTLDYQTRALGFARNRAGLPYTETAVPVLTARDGAGQPRAVMFSYGCHPVSAGMADLYDGDFPAGACSAVEAAWPGCFALYLQGAAGDQDPSGLSGWSLRDAHAAALGDVVSTALGARGRPVTGPLLTSHAEVDLPLDVTLTPDNLAQVRACFVARTANPEGLPAWYVRHAEVMIGQIDGGTVPTHVPLPLHVWTMQGTPRLRIVLVGGELVSGYAAYLRSHHGGDELVVGGYAGEVTCYVPSDEFLPPFMRGGSYEGGWHDDFPGIAGGSQTVYGHLARFAPGASGIEATLLDALAGLLA